MKKLIEYLLLIMLLGFCGCASKKYTPALSAVAEQAAVPAVNFSEQSTWLLGYINPSLFTREPHSSWYFKGYDDYRINPEALNKLLEINKDGLTIKIVMGTWCPDSRREVPRFMRILDQWQFSVAKVTFIGVDNAKLSPVGEYDNLDIQRVPTFIIYKNNIESGRIIENPKTSLEQDIVNIITSK
jgi:thiol-disulfide isomerase/thioredoxin